MKLPFGIDESDLLSLRHMLGADWVAIAHLPWRPSWELQVDLPDMVPGLRQQSFALDTSSRSAFLEDIAAARRNVDAERCARHWSAVDP